METGLRSYAINSHIRSVISFARTVEQDDFFWKDVILVCFFESSDWVPLHSPNFWRCSSLCLYSKWWIKLLVPPVYANFTPHKLQELFLTFFPSIVTSTTEKNSQTGLVRFFADITCSVRDACNHVSSTCTHAHRLTRGTRTIRSLSSLCTSGNDDTIRVDVMTTITKMNCLHQSGPLVALSSATSWTFKVAGKEGARLRKATPRAHQFLSKVARTKKMATRITESLPSCLPACLKNVLLCIQLIRKWERTTDLDSLP